MLKPEAFVEVKKRERKKRERKKGGEEEGEERNGDVEVVERKRRR